MLVTDLLVVVRIIREVAVYSLKRTSEAISLHINFNINIIYFKFHFLMFNIHINESIHIHVNNNNRILLVNFIGSQIKIVLLFMIQIRMQISKTIICLLLLF